MFHPIRDIDSGDYAGRIKGSLNVIKVNFSSFRSSPAQGASLSFLLRCGTPRSRRERRWNTDYPISREQEPVGDLFQWGTVPESNREEVDGTM